MSIDYQDNAGFTLQNPNKPAVEHLSVQELSQWLSEERDFYLYDVRGYSVRRQIEQAIPFNQQTIQDLEDLPKDTILVFQCHHGMRSMAAAQQVLSLGFSRVYNLSGGIHAWSTQIDSSVPVY